MLEGQILWLAGDPATEMAQVRCRITEARNRAEEYRTGQTIHGQAARSLGPRLAKLAGLLAKAYLLDLPNQAEIVERLTEEHREAVAARSELARCAGSAEIVQESLNTLRRPPLTDGELNELRHQVKLLREQRDHLGAAIEAIEYVRDHAEALDWRDAEEKLQQNEALIPGLKEQRQMAENALRKADEAESLAEKLFDEAHAAWQEADTTCHGVKKRLTSLEERLEETRIAKPTAEAVQMAATEVARAESDLEWLKQREGELGKDFGRKETVCVQETEKLKEAEEKLRSEQGVAAPAVLAWDQLHGRAASLGLLASLLQSEVPKICGHLNLEQETQKQRAVLIERLRSAKDGQSLLADAETASDTREHSFADSYLELWLNIRNWLRRHLPAAFAEVDDPREGLIGLRDKLADLEKRLAGQENDLRGRSEDVAQGISTQIRKARNQVNRLKKSLEGIGFGSIMSIRVQLEPIEKMEQVLRALREGEAQALLFQKEISIEDALNEIFRRHGGGSTGGKHLLDYRQYVHLQVEIKRRSGKAWEIANATRVSTGEAIGVGAALMMVILTEWESDANVNRAKKSNDSLRFLFLDEANRLSQDNLKVLFDLCQNLDLQLLIAAPEVACAEGNTTYRLVRRIADDAREEVIVTGRRPEAQV